MFSDDVTGLWKLTAYELDELIDAGRRKQRLAAEENELLAYNIGALVLTAFNAPLRYPTTPAEAFGKTQHIPSDGGKSSFMLIADRLNRKLRDKNGEITT